MFHVVCVTDGVTDLVTGQLSWHTLVLATSKFSKSRQADLWLGYTSEKEKSSNMNTRGCRTGRAGGTDRPLGEAREVGGEQESKGEAAPRGLTQREGGR